MLQRNVMCAHFMLRLFTCFKWIINIKKLLAGETLVYNIKSKQFVSRKKIQITPGTGNKFNKDEFRQMAHDTVKMCSIGQRQIGVFLSGGLDSSLIAHELNKIIISINEADVKDGGEGAILIRLKNL